MAHRLRPRRVPARTSFWLSKFREELQQPPMAQLPRVTEERKAEIEGSPYFILHLHAGLEGEKSWQAEAEHAKSLGRTVHLIVKKGCGNMLPKSFIRGLKLGALIEYGPGCILHGNEVRDHKDALSALEDTIGDSRPMPGFNVKR